LEAATAGVSNILAFVSLYSECDRDVQGEEEWQKNSALLLMIKY
jgi:hypothetical protein